ncbi:hypothetical protein HPP92_016687 [Vanilla planifolia]|uniref:Uncharacterized protein n=1 Tax=Vanilla planifolia TaxID=51239 RepID=A0A835UQ81_VANPL|nr:hypothetical protein HPP92_016687 [Vanilla planifolia]
MAQIGHFRFQKHVSDDHPATVRAAAVEEGTTVGRRCLSGCGGIGRRLVRKLKKQSKLLCSAAGGCLPSGNAALCVASTIPQLLPKL